MFILHGLLLSVAYFLAGWLLMEIPVSLAEGLYNRMRHGIFDVQFARPSAIKAMVEVEILVLSLVSLAIGIELRVVVVAALARYFLFSLLQG